MLKLKFAEEYIITLISLEQNNYGKKITHSLTVLYGIILKNHDMIIAHIKKILDLNK